MLTIIFIFSTMILECFIFAIALQIALLVIDGAERPRQRRCARCGNRFTAEPMQDVAFCGFCAVVVIYEQHDRAAQWRTPERAQGRGIIRAYGGAGSKQQAASKTAASACC